MEHYEFEQGSVSIVSAWTRDEIVKGIQDLLLKFEDELPVDRRARIVLKPNLNNDLIALTGNSVDLRVIVALIECLAQRGYSNLAIADGPNVGVHRRGIDVFKRLRIDAVAAMYGVDLLDLNADVGIEVHLPRSGCVRVSRAVVECDFIINIPTVKTHTQMGLSCAMKNWMGIVVGKDKRQMHHDLARNIVAVHLACPPDLVLVDGIVGMEGNGPGDGDPVRLGRLVMSNSSALTDVVVAGMVGLPIASIPYLIDSQRLMPSLSDVFDAVKRTVDLVRRFRTAPQPTFWARLIDSPWLLWLKWLARPITQHELTLAAAYQLGLVQDVYARVDDAVTSVRRNPTVVGVSQSWSDYCPTGLTAEEIGDVTQNDRCIQCLYCWWVDSNNGLDLVGDVGHLRRQIDRYKQTIEGL